MNANLWLQDISVFPTPLKEQHKECEVVLSLTGTVGSKTGVTEARQKEKAQA